MMNKINKKTLFFALNLILNIGFFAWSQENLEQKKTPKNMVYEFKTTFDDTMVNTSENRLLIETFSYAVQRNSNLNQTRDFFLDITKDTIWSRVYDSSNRFVTVRSFTNDSIVNYHESRKSAKSNSYPFSLPLKIDKEYEISIIKEETKKILNYNCFLVKLKIYTLNDIGSFNFIKDDLGPEIVEMYVTEDIILPPFLNPLIELNIKEHQFFPLEIKSYQEKMASIFKEIKIKEINF